VRDVNFSNVKTRATWEAGVWVSASAYMAQVKAGTAPMLAPEQAVALVSWFKFGGEK